MSLILEIDDVLMGSRFQLDKLDLLADSSRLGFKQRDSGIVIQRWHDYSLNNPHGDLDELSLKAYQKIRKLSPKLGIKLLRGDATDAYSLNERSHFFLSVYDGKYNEPLLVDAGLGVVIEQTQAFYRVDMAFESEFADQLVRRGSSNVTLAPSRSTMIGYDFGEGGLCYLGRYSGRAYDNSPIFTTMWAAPMINISRKFRHEDRNADKISHLVRNLETMAKSALYNN